MPTAPVLTATTVATQFGDISFMTSPDGEVRASGFGTPAQVAAAHPDAVGAAEWVPGDCEPVAAAVRAWDAGELDALDSVRAAQPGGPFMQRAWEAMRRVRAGQTVTYGELALRAGSPLAMRAAGQACARNALAPFVPCHRIVASTGVGNYGYGTENKRRMLAHEGIPPERLA